MLVLPPDLTVRSVYGLVCPSSLSSACFLRLDAGEPTSPGSRERTRGRGARRRATGAKATFKAKPAS